MQSQCLCDTNASPTLVSCIACFNSCLHFPIHFTEPLVRVRHIVRDVCALETTVDSSRHKRYPLVSLVGHTLEAVRLFNTALSPVEGKLKCPWDSTGMAIVSEFTGQPDPVDTTIFLCANHNTPVTFLNSRSFTRELLSVNVLSRNESAVDHWHVPKRAWLCPCITADRSGRLYPRSLRWSFAVASPPFACQGPRHSTKPLEQSSWPSSPPYLSPLS